MKEMHKTTLVNIDVRYSFWWYLELFLPSQQRIKLLSLRNDQNRIILKSKLVEFFCRTGKAEKREKIIYWKFVCGSNFLLNFAML